MYPLLLLIFCALTGMTVLFQLALALGAPWGEYAMGGKFPGRFPAGMRIAAVMQLFLLVLMALAVLARAGVALTPYHAPSRYAIWGIVAFMLLGAFLNTITPSRKETMVWAPVTSALFLSSLIVALN